MPNTRTLYMEKTKPGKFKSVIIRYTPLEMASFDNHQTYLDRLCRLCLGKNQTRKEEVSGKVPIPTAPYASKILSTFGVNVLADQVGVHPSHICRSCYDKLRRPMKRIAVEWEAHFPHQRIPIWYVKCTSRWQGEVGQRNLELALQQMS